MILLADTDFTDIVAKISNWPMAFVVAILIICFTSFLMEKWPWEK